MINAIAVDDEPLALELIQALCEKNDNVTLKRVFTKPREAIRYLTNFPVDLFFCDIQMPSVTGINLVKSLSHHTMVIFTTAFSEYAALSYDLNAIDYLLKPINQQRFDRAIAKAVEYWDYINSKEQAECKHIFVRADFSLIKINLDEILYIEGLADYARIYVRERRTIVIRMPMKELIKKLPPAQFVRVHRSYILPFDKIDSVKGATISIGGKKFPLGKTFSEDFFKQYIS